LTEPARPEPLWQLDVAFAAATLAHETIYRLHRERIVRGDEPPSELLAESARIALHEIPGLLAPATALGSRWEDEAVLDPLA